MSKVDRGPASFSGPSNILDDILDNYIDEFIQVCLQTPSGDEVHVTGYNRGNRIETLDGTVYHYSMYKVADIY
jgi:hypothetical protein